jgi:hypothetical protein
MTGDNNGHGVSVVRHAYRPKSLSPPNRAGNICVGSGLAIGDFEQCFPTGYLKFGPAQVHGEVELSSRSVEVFFEFTDVQTQRLFRLLESYSLSLGSDITGIGANALLAGQSPVKFQRNQATV